MSEDVILESVPCPMGCTLSDEVVLVGRDMLHSIPGEYAVVKCNCCGLMRTNPRPTASTIGKYYPDDYGPYLGTAISVSQVRSSFWNRVRAIVRRVFDSRAQSIPAVPPSNMLEIGCASGAFLQEMALRGWNVEGVEFSEAPAAAARSLGFRVQAGALEMAEKPLQPVDLVVGWMVLEHLHDPVACLRKLRDWSTDGAMIAISVPDAGALEFRLFRSEWYALQLPGHLYHFTPETLTALLRRGGWEVERVFHQRSYSNMTMSASYMAKRLGWHRLSGLLQKVSWPAGIWFYIVFPMCWLLAAVGQTGRMTVWARKRRDNGRGVDGASNDFTDGRL